MLWVVVEREKDIGPEEKIKLLRAFSNKNDAKRFIEQYLRKNKIDRLNYYEEENEFGYFSDDNWYVIFAQKVKFER